MRDRQGARLCEAEDVRVSKQFRTAHVSVCRIAVDIMPYGWNGERGETWTLMACVNSGNHLVFYSSELIEQSMVGLIA